MKIKPIILLFLAFSYLFTKTAEAQKSDKQQNNKAKVTIVQYVSYEKAGSGSGDSKQDAADFLNTSFWDKVNITLKKQPVKVLFLEGDYKRAFTHKPLTLKEIGNAENALVLEGVEGKTIFTANPAEYAETRGVMVDIVNSQNIEINNFAFTGNGKVGYALRITSNSDKETKDILVKNCVWTDMRGIIYGATGVHQKNTKNVTYLNCVFKRVGIDSHSHHIYNAYNPSYIYVINSHFEDCTGDYVRFRDSTDYCVVSGSKFVRNNDFPTYPFISMPNFNKKRAESFASNYAFFNNEFINNGEKELMNGIALHHYGFNRPGFNYLLTSEEGKILENGSDTEKRQLLVSNFGIKPDLIRVYNNRYSGKIKNKVAVGSFPAYGAESKGWKGFGDVYNIVKTTNVPFKWENGKASL